MRKVSRLIRLPSGVFLVSFAFFLMQTQPHAANDTTIDELIKTYSSQGKSTANAGKGEKFYFAKNPSAKDGLVNCASCHKDNPTESGLVKKSGKKLEPMAVSANKNRYKDKKKVEKWFKRNCNDVLARLCTAQEKADFLAYMKSK